MRRLLGVLLSLLLLASLAPLSVPVTAHQRMYCGGDPTPQYSILRPINDGYGNYASNLSFSLSQEGLDALACTGATHLMIEFRITKFEPDGALGFSVDTANGFTSQADTVDYIDGVIVSRSYGFDIDTINADQEYGFDFAFWNVEQVGRSRISAYWVPSKWEPTDSSWCDGEPITYEYGTACNVELGRYLIARSNF